MTTTTNADDLLIVSDEIKTENNDFLFFDTPETSQTETLISFDEATSKIEDNVDFGFSFDTPVETKEEISFEEKSENVDFFADSTLAFDASLETKEEISPEIALDESTTESFEFGFNSPKVEEISELIENPIELENIETETKKEDIFAMETLSPAVSEKMTSVVGDLNSILDETISKLELRKTNLFALKDNKTTNIDDLNKQIAELKAKVKELEGEVKSLETEDEQIEANITALQAMKLGEAVNNKDYKKTTKKVA